MHAVDAEVVQKGIEIVGGSAGLRTGRWIDDRPPEVPPIESNEAVTCSRERRDLVFPYAHAAGSGVKEYHGYSASAAVHVPQFGASNSRKAFAGGDAHPSGSWRWRRRVLRKKFQNEPVKDFRLFPVGGMPRFGDHTKLRAGNMSRKDTHDIRWHREVVVAGQQERRCLYGLQHRQSLLDQGRLSRRPRLLGSRIDVEPFLHAIGIRCQITEVDLPEPDGQRVVLLRTSSRNHFRQHGIRNLSGGRGEHEVDQAFRMGQHIIERDESSPGDAHQVEFFETQKIRECLKVFGDRAGLRTGRRLGHTATPTAPVKCDHPVARLLKGWNVVLPAIAVTSVRVQQNHGDATAARVREPESNSGQLGISLARGSRRCSLESNETAGAHAEQRNRDDSSYPGTESIHRFFRHGFLARISSSGMLKKSRGERRFFLESTIRQCETLRHFSAIKTLLHARSARSSLADSAGRSNLTATSSPSLRSRPGILPHPPAPSFARMR